MVECPSGLRSTPRKRVRFSASESSNLSSTAPWDSKRFLESLFSCGSPPFFRAVATVQRYFSVLQSIAKGYKRRHREPQLSPPWRSETVIVRRQEKGDEKHGDRGCGKLEKTERPDSPPTPLQQKRRLDTTRPGHPAKTEQRACMFAALHGNQRHEDFREPVQRRRSSLHSAHPADAFACSHRGRRRRAPLPRPVRRA